MTKTPLTALDRDSDFFAEQENYHRQSHIWLFGFFLATIFNILSSNLLLLLLFWNSESGFWGSLESHSNYYIILTAIMALIAVVATFINLQSAENIKNFIPSQAIRVDERLKNFMTVVNTTHEMAIAAGINPPRIYILDSSNIDEMNKYANSGQVISEYANGLGIGSSEKSIIIITREVIGLPRDEMQALLAHCMGGIIYSNSSMDALIAGGMSGPHFLFFVGLAIATLLGAIGNGLGFILGIPFILLGGIGLLIARYFKCKIAQARVFLCDAAAVQFTRHPQSIINLLERIPDTVFDFNFKEDHLREFFFNHITTSNLDSRMRFQPDRQQRIDRLAKYIPAHRPQ